MTTSPLKSPEAMSKLKTPEELAEEMHYAKGHLSRVAQEHIARGITYTREHEVKPLVRCLRDLRYGSFKDEEAVNELIDKALSLYTNNEGK